MSESLILFISVIVSIGLGVYIGLIMSKFKNKSEISMLNERQYQLERNITEIKNQLSEAELQKENFRQAKSRLDIELAMRNTEFENLERLNLERDKELQKQQEQLRKDFELLANRIFDNKSEKFTLQNKENLKNILHPLQEKIKTFEEKVDQSQKDSISMHSALKEQLLGLRDLNQQMAKEATNLTRALKGDSKMQGNWGELILTRILEKSGLEKDREYTVQDSHSSEDGRRLQTDVLIHLPDGKKMIVDSKVSLVNFERFVSEEDEEQKQLHLKQHIASIKRHVEQLSAKNYQHLIDESPDTIFMFIPIEPAFAIASAHEPNLYEQAFDRQVIIVTPATLLAALRLVDNLWQNDRQKQNAIEIATEAGNLYDSFINLTDELIKVGKQIGTVQNSYEGAMKKLTGRGNIIKRVEKLKKLGAKASKNMNENLLKRAEEHDVEDEDFGNLLN